MLFRSEGAHGKSPKCLDGNLGDFGEFCKGPAISTAACGRAAARHGPGTGSGCGSSPSFFPARPGQRDRRRGGAAPQPTLQHGDEVGHVPPRLHLGHLFPPAVELEVQLVRSRDDHRLGRGGEHRRAELPAAVMAHQDVPDRQGPLPVEPLFLGQRHEPVVPQDDMVHDVAGKRHLGRRGQAVGLELEVCLHHRWMHVLTI